MSDAGSGGKDYRRELEVAIAIVRDAGRVILGLLGRAAVMTKPDGSPVTEADYASDATIRTGLRAAFPADAILTEEGEDDPARLAHERCWIADPIDGTAYFAAGSNDFDVFLALVIAGRPVVGVSYQPATGLLLAAGAGSGAWIERTELPREPLSFPSMTGSRVLAPKGWLGAPANLPLLRRVAERVGNTTVVEAARSLCPRALLPGESGVDAIAGVPMAGGRVDAWEWDIGAFDLVVREAGGAATDLRGEPLRFNRPRPAFDEGLLISRDRDWHRDFLSALTAEME